MSMKKNNITKEAEESPEELERLLGEEMREAKAWVNSQEISAFHEELKEGILRENEMLLEAERQEKEKRIQKHAEAFLKINLKSKQNSNESHLTISQACDKYLILRKPEITAATYRTWKSHFNLLIKTHGERACKSITQEDISTIFIKMNEEKKSIGTIDGYVTAFTGLFQYLIDDQKIETNPVRKPKFARTIRAQMHAERDRPRQPYEKHDLEKMFDRAYLLTIKRPDLLFLPLLGIFTGARLEAMCRLKVSEFKKNKNGLYSVNFEAEHDKKGASREVPLRPTLIESGIVKYIQEC